MTGSIDRFAKVDDVVPNGGRDEDGSHRTLGRWTFEYAPARDFVQDRLKGRVLNACAGRTKLDHDHEIVRNDLNPDRDADTHHDVAEIADHFEMGSFDTVIFDPPFDDTQADDKYDGLRADDVLEAFWQFARLLRSEGRVITFGWNSWGMSSVDGFVREETNLLQRGPCLRDVVVTVDRRDGYILGGFGTRNSRSDSTDTDQQEGAQ